MARGAAEPSSKRAKAGEADNEEVDRLVRRKEEVVRLLGRARKGKEGNKRAKEELLSLCARLEAKNEKLWGRLLPELWQKILEENLDQNDMVALASTCRFFRDMQKDLGLKVEGRELKTSVTRYSTSHSLGWFQWACDTFEILPGFEWDDKERVKEAVYEGDLVNCAALQGSVEILRWLLEEKGWSLNEYTGWLAGMGGSVEVLEFLVDKDYEFDESACAGAVEGGHLEALTFLRSLDPPCPWSADTCAWAALRGRLEVLQWLRAQDPPCPWDHMTCDHAAEGGHLDILKWARSQNQPCPWNEETCEGAAAGGQLGVLKWLRAQDPPCPWNHMTCTSAAEGGHLNILKWARSQNPPCPWDGKTCSWAAKGGRLEVLKFARAQNPPCPWDAETCSQAAGEGHLEVLQWVREQGLPCLWNVGTCEQAAFGGHVEVLQWLRAQDPPCPWDGWACAGVAWDGQLEILKWLRAQNPPCPWSRRECIEKALEGGHQHVIDWIDQQEDGSDVHGEHFELRYFEDFRMS